MSGYSFYQPQNANPNDGELITLCKILERLFGGVNTQAANGAITMTNSSVGTASATLLAASTATKTLTIQNTSANTLYVSTTTPATASNGIVIGAGVGYQFPFVPTNALYCLGSSASTTYTLWYA